MASRAPIPTVVFRPVGQSSLFPPKERILREVEEMKDDTRQRTAWVKAVAFYKALTPTRRARIRARWRNWKGPKHGLFLLTICRNEVGRH